MVIVDPFLCLNFQRTYKHINTNKNIVNIRCCFKVRAVTLTGSGHRLAHFLSRENELRRSTPLVIGKQKRDTIGISLLFVVRDSEPNSNLVYSKRSIVIYNQNMLKDIESFPKSELRARAGLPEIDERLKTPPRPIFRTIVIIGIILFAVFGIIVLLFSR